MVFGIIMLLKRMHPDTIERLSLVHPEAMMGLLMGGAVIYWFTGASTQAVVTGAYRAVEYIKKNMKIEGAEKASTEDSKMVVAICAHSRFPDAAASIPGARRSVLTGGGRCLASGSVTTEGYLSTKPIPARERLILALDVASLLERLLRDA